jgi:hypothetical protein
LVDTYDSDGIKVQVNLKRSARVDDADITVEKRLLLKEDFRELQVRYRILDAPKDFLDTYSFLVDFPIYFNSEPKEFVLRHGYGEANPLDDMEFEATTFTLKEPDGFVLDFEFSCLCKVWAYSHDTYSRMNTDDYQSKFEGIGLVFSPTEKEFKINVKISAGK